MKMSLRFTAGALLVLTTQAVCSAQHYRQTNLVSNTSGVAPVTDPQLVNSWGLSRSSSSRWWIADNGTGLSTLYDGTGSKQQEHATGYTDRHHRQQQPNRLLAGPRSTGHVPLLHD